MIHHKISKETVYLLDKVQITKNKLILNNWKLWIEKVSFYRIQLRKFKVCKEVENNFAINTLVIKNIKIVLVLKHK